MKPAKVLITGARGQIGTELVEALIVRHGAQTVLCTDIRAGEVAGCEVTPMDVTKRSDWEDVLARHEISDVYHLAAVLSANAETYPAASWNANMTGLLVPLELAREGRFQRMFWPSSIAVFGPSTPSVNAPQDACTDPTTVYGISKLAGERWCSWYRLKHGIDVRSLRYPGLISWKSPPGGGTTDYAIEIFRAARDAGKYTCFLEENEGLPMMHMSDAVRACLQIMDSPMNALRVNGSYNIGAMTVTPRRLAEAIASRFPRFRMECVPDFRQSIAASWPQSVDDSAARADWGWASEWTFDATVDDMAAHFLAGIAPGCRGGDISI